MNTAHTQKRDLAEWELRRLDKLDDAKALHELCIPIGEIAARLKVAESLLRSYFECEVA